MKLCECKCGQKIINEKNKFINGHNRKGTLHTEQWKQNQSQKMKNHKVSNETREKLSIISKGLKRTPEQNLRNSLAQRGKIRSEEMKLAQSKRMLGHIVTQKTKDKIAILTTGRKHSQEAILKITKNNKMRGKFGKLNPFFGKTHTEEERKHHSNLMTGRKHSEETKLKLSISAIKKIENQKFNGEPLIPRVGDIERIFLDELRQYINYNIIRQDISFRYIVGQYPDGHIPELNLFIQFDEKEHFINTDYINYQPKDIQKTLNLASLGYIVYRVSEKNWLENKEQVISQFQILINELEQQTKENKI